LWGGQATLGAAAGALALTLAIGAPLGLAAGYWGGWVDAILMRLVDVLLAFPGLLLALGIVAIRGPSQASIIIAVGLAGMPGYARVARAAALEVRNQPYVQAARALGASDLRLLVRHIAPNALGAMLAFATVQLGWSLLNAAALSFLGLAGSPARPEWGTLLADGREHLVEAPWLSLAPGLALTLTVLAANLIGDGLREPPA
jgi:ABC-type dipeptide/oligopeptide/nickel transport system permease subunit